MTRNIPAAGEFYRHFKGNIYQVKSIATDSETGKKMVVYQAMYPPFGMWVRSLEMFMSETDHQKYPDCSQQFRFEKVVFDGQENVQEAGNENIPENVSEKTSEKQSVRVLENISDEELKKIIINGQIEKSLLGKIPEEEIAQRGFMMILDAESYHERYQLFVGLENYLDERLLSNIAVAFDIVLADGTKKEHYDTILANLQAWDHYEDRRLR